MPAHIIEMNDSTLIKLKMDNAIIIEIDTLKINKYGKVLDKYFLAYKYSIKTVTKIEIPVAIIAPIAPYIGIKIRLNSKFIKPPTSIKVHKPDFNCKIFLGI